MNITCEFKKMRDRMWLITSPGKMPLSFAIGSRSKVRCAWGGDYLIVRSPNGAYYLRSYQSEEMDTGRLTFEIL